LRTYFDATFVIVCEVRARLAVTNMMKLAAGSVAQQQNLRKGHEPGV